MPDYTAEVAGVRLSGVRGDSPADKAGLKGGDVIVEFGGQKIATFTITRTLWKRCASGSRLKLL